MIDLAALILACAQAVHPDTMQAVVAHESSRHPYAIAYRGGSIYPKTRGAAAAEARRLLAAGVRFDAGLAQISSANFSWLGLDAESVFDPCENLRAGARVLADGYRRARANYADEQQALDTALSYYNTGDAERGKTSGYVEAVRRHAVPALAPREGAAVILQAVPEPGKREPPSPLAVEVQRGSFDVQPGGIEAGRSSSLDVGGASR